MPLSKDALELIIADAIAATKDLGTYYPSVVLPENMKINDLEKFQIYKYRFTACYKTERLSDFASYVDKYTENLSVTCYIDANKTEATVIFDVGTLENPEHAKHRASLVLRETAAFEAFQEACDSRKSQQDTAEFLEDWIDEIAFLDVAGSVMSREAAIQAIRTVEINQENNQVHGVQQFSVNQSSIEKLDAAGADKKPLPSYIIFKCAPYYELKEREIRCRVSLLVTRDRVEFMLKTIKLKELREEVMQEFRENIEISFSSNIPVLIGTLSI